MLIVSLIQHLIQEAGSRQSKEIDNGPQVVQEEATMAFLLTRSIDHDDRLTTQQRKSAPEHRSAPKRMINSRIGKPSGSLTRMNRHCNRLTTTTRMELELTRVRHKKHRQVQASNSKYRSAPRWIKLTMTTRSRSYQKVNKAKVNKGRMDRQWRPTKKND